VTKTLIQRTDNLCYPENGVVSLASVLVEEYAISLTARNRVLIGYEITEGQS
jgi:hypothetical protein